MSYLGMFDNEIICEYYEMYSERYSISWTIPLKDVILNLSTYIDVIRPEYQNMIKSIIAQYDKKGFITEKQHNALLNSFIHIEALWESKELV